MKKYGSLLLIFIISSLMSCQDSGSGSDLLTITPKFSNMILIDGGGKSCTLQLTDPAAEDDLASLKGILGGVSITWTGTSDFEILYLKLTFSGSGIGSSGTLIKTITGSELSYLLKGSSGVPTITSGQTLVSATGCNWEIGAIEIDDKSKSSFGQVTLLVYGVSTIDGQKVPISAQTYLSYQYDGI